MELVVGVLQLHGQHQDPAHNLASAEHVLTAESQRLELGKNQHIDVLLLPELAFAAFDMHQPTSMYART